MELSIVLVIIGFIAGGVIVGKSLILQTKILSVITDQDRYVKAAVAFRSKYNALPGDMSNATSQWGANSSCPPAAATIPQQATCNGDGNGLINMDGTSNNTATTSPFENYLAWQQLANAGFIPGSYSGAPGPNATYTYSDNEPGLNVPAGRLDGSGFEWAAFDTNTGASRYSTVYLLNIVSYQQYLMFGGVTGSDLFAPLLTSADAMTIDLKIDDGMPASGTVLSYIVNPITHPARGSNCVVTSNPITASTYNTAKTLPACILLFKVQW